MTRKILIGPGTLGGRAASKADRPINEIRDSGGLAWSTCRRSCPRSRGQRDHDIRERLHSNLHGPRESVGREEAAKEATEESADTRKGNRSIFRPAVVARARVLKVAIAT